jgi:hypothetical protein
MKRLPLLLTFLLTTAFTAFAGDQIKRKVKVMVDGSAEASSFLTRELRTLGDVEVVSTNQDYTINLLVLKTHTKQSIPTGFVLSLVITRRNSIALVLEGVTNRITDTLALGMVNSASVASQDLVLLDAHEVETCGPDDLRKACEGMVARFDAEHLEPARQSWKKLQDMIKKTPQSTRDPISLGLGPRRITNTTPTSP